MRPDPKRAEAEAGNVGRRPTAFAVSDVLLYREGLALRFRREPLVELVGTGPPGEATLSTLERLAPDAVILDLAMAESLVFAEAVRRRLPAARTVAFAVSNLDTCLAACARAGIVGYVAKDGTLEDIVTAVLHAVRGELHCTPRFAAMLLMELAATAGESAPPVLPAGGARLTPRQQEILDQIGHGRSNKEIARQLGISPATVKNHVHHLLERLALSRRSQAMALVIGRPLPPAAAPAGAACPPDETLSP